MIPWHVNEGLAPLITQIKAAHPGIVVGTIGDEAHQQRTSDHNPNSAGRVNAADYMLGPAFPEAAALALLPFLIADARTHYVIHDRRIWESENPGWVPYAGDPHTSHIHHSVKDSAYTDPSPWRITARLLELATPPMTGDDVRTLQRKLGGGLDVDGIYGPATAAAVRSYQGAHHLSVDGIVGPLTRKALHL